MCARHLLFAGGGVVRGDSVMAESILRGCLLIVAARLPCHWSNAIDRTSQCGSVYAEQSIVVGEPRVLDL